jgi:hypothetical protein
MWKVKRMNTARSAELTIAVGAGDVAAYFASGSDKALPPQLQAWKEKDSHNAVGEQAEMLARMPQTGALSAALHSNALETGSDEQGSKCRDSIDAVRHAALGPTAQK